MTDSNPSGGHAKSSNRRSWLGAFGLTATWLLASSCASRAPAPPLRQVSSATSSGAQGLAYRVLLPPGYPQEEPYPVLYFLHDYYGGSETLWRRGIADELAASMRAGRLAPMVIVAPEGDHSYWSDVWDGSNPYESRVTGALREEVERRYAVRRDRGGRAVTGISMGGFGAVKAALRRPELYVAASSLSGALLALDAESIATYPSWTRRQLARIFGPLDEPRSTHAANDLRLLLSAAEPSALPALLLRCGKEDEYGLAGLQQDLAAFARTHGIEVTAELEPGEHDWDYWRTSLVEVVDWHAARFAPPRPEKGGDR